MDERKQETGAIVRGLRTDLIEPFVRHFRIKNAFGLSAITAIKNLQRIHKAGFEFKAVSEFEEFLREKWPDRIL